MSTDRLDYGFHRTCGPDSAMADLFWWVWSALPPIVLLFFLTVFLFIAGLPIPVGVNRGKVKWLKWCGMGMHTHIVYRTERGFQTLHPEDQDGGERR